MKLRAEIEGEASAVVEIKREGARVFADIDGRCYEVEVRAPQPGVYLLLVDGQVYECRVDYPGGKQAVWEVIVGNRAYAVTLTDPKRLRGGESAGASLDGTVKIVAPMPGKVVRMLVEEGAQVGAGDGIVIVEAMKMQNELKSPKAGKVINIKTSAGATVNAGDVLAAVE